MEPHAGGPDVLSEEVRAEAEAGYLIESFIAVVGLQHTRSSVGWRRSRKKFSKDKKKKDKKKMKKELKKAKKKEKKR